MNSAADARHTKARSSVYSMRSWPCSSLTKLNSSVFMMVHSLTVFCDPEITCLGFRDLAITLFSAVRNNGNLCAAGGTLLVRPEHDRDAIVIDGPPPPGFLEGARQ